MIDQGRMRTINESLLNAMQNTTTIYYLSMKEGSFFLFCIVIMRITKPGCVRSCSWCLWKALNEEGCMGLVP
jgi:hypothetical protein